MRFQILWLCAVLALSGSATEVVTTRAGDGTLSSDAFLPSYLALDPLQNIYFIGSSGAQLLGIPSGSNKAIVLAGSETQSGFAGDGMNASKALFTKLGGIATDAAGNLFLLDGVRIRRIDIATAIITTMAGNGTASFAGDGGPATAAALNPACPYSGLAVDARGNLYFADTNNFRIRRIDAVSGVITTIAGNGNRGTAAEGLPALQAALEVPAGVAVDALGNVFFTELGGVSRVRRIDAQTHALTTVAGKGVAGQPGGSGYSGDGGLATAALLYGPFGLTFDPAGNLIIADAGNERIRQVDKTTQIITTLAGGGTVVADGCLPKSAALFLPWGVAYDKNGNLIITDIFGSRVREILAGSLTDTEDPDGDGYSNVIEAAAGTDPASAASMPLSANAASASIEHCTVTAAFNALNANRARLAMKGTLFSPDKPAFANAKVICAFGGMTRVFTLSKSGAGHAGKDSMKFSYNVRKELIAFTGTVQAADFGQILATGTAFAVPASKQGSAALFVLFQNTIFTGNVDLSFSTSKTVKVSGMTAGGGFGVISGRH